jgi:hypothetical protein
VQRAHFRHCAGEGTPACDVYFPGKGNGGEAGSRALAAVEEEPSELGLLLTQLDGSWGLGLRLPEIPGDELKEESLTALLSAYVDIYSGTTPPLRLPAIDLRPGVGAARVEVAPSLHTFRTQPAGLWPAGIQCDRWRLEARGLDGKGVLFRLRRGEWIRLIAGSSVHLGETVLVLADTRCAPPVIKENHQRLAGGGLQWCIWEVRLPSEPQEPVTAWLANLGHQLVQGPWCIDLVTPPRRYSESGVPFFWVKDSPILAFEAPQPSATAMVEIQSGTNSCLGSIGVTHGSPAHVAVGFHDVGLVRITVAGERGTSLYIGFERPPLPNGFPEQLASTPRLRMRVGSQNLEAWRGVDHHVPVPSRQRPAVQVDLGCDTVRARVTVWERGRQRIRRGLDAKGVERAIDDALATASRIEVDADNLGRIVVLPTRMDESNPQEHIVESRLAWWEVAMGSASQHDKCTVPTVVGRPGSSAVSIRRSGAAALVRARLALRGRLDGKGASR